MKNETISIKGIDLPQSVIRLGDGSLLCDKHLAEQYPDIAEPENGWEWGICSMCGK